MSVIPTLPPGISLPDVIMAVGGLGTAAFGVLEAIKPVFPTLNHIGFGGIRRAVSNLTPEVAGGGAPVNALPRSKVLDSLLANWVNGNDLGNQKTIAKSLIKLHMSTGNAAALAAATNVDAALLIQAAASIEAGAALTQQQTDAYSRFDLIVTALLDEVYQHADAYFRNWMRGLAAAIAVVLAVAGGYVVTDGFRNWGQLLSAVLVGLLATPLAPIAKDVSTALATAVNTMQMLKGK
ncbi:MAG TPA: hypothetical protein VGR47_10775 [Terracidiphilus sp.]|nr:hypothetical protein [Terracidiphilus sp.]